MASPFLANSSECKDLYMKLSGKLIMGLVRFFSCWQKNGNWAEDYTSLVPATVFWAFMHQGWAVLYSPF